MHERPRGNTSQRLMARGRIKTDLATKLAREREALDRSIESATRALSSSAAELVALRRAFVAAHRNSDAKKIQLTEAATTIDAMPPQNTTQPLSAEPRTDENILARFWARSQTNIVMWVIENEQKLYTLHSSSSQTSVFTTKCLCCLKWFKNCMILIQRGFGIQHCLWCEARMRAVSYPQDLVPATLQIVPHFNCNSSWQSCTYDLSTFNFTLPQPPVRPYFQLTKPLNATRFPLFNLKPTTAKNDTSDSYFPPFQFITPEQTQATIKPKPIGVQQSQTGNTEDLHPSEWRRIMGFEERLRIQNAKEAPGICFSPQLTDGSYLWMKRTMKCNVLKEGRVSFWLDDLA